MSGSQKWLLFLFKYSYKKFIKLFIFKDIIFAVTTSHKIGCYGTEKKQYARQRGKCQQKTIFNILKLK